MRRVKLPATPNRSTTRNGEGSVKDKCVAIRLVAACLLGCVGAWGQGTLAQVAAGGGWQTTITLLNLSATPATAQVTFYSDSGGPLAVTPVGQEANSQFTLSLPGNGSAQLVIPNVGPSSEGWARVDSVSGGAIGGQGTFVYYGANGTQWEGGLPLTPLSSKRACIIPLPAPPTATILMPFDSSAGTVTGFAIANLTSNPQSVSIEFDDQSQGVLQTDTFNMDPLSHTAFGLADRYPALANHQGVLRVTAAPDAIGILGLRFAASGAFSTLIPLYP